MKFFGAIGSIMITLLNIVSNMFEVPQIPTVIQVENSQLSHSKIALFSFTINVKNIWGL
jgi:hypothetical protein